MAKKGIRYVCFAHATVDSTSGAITYAEGCNISPVAVFNGSVNKANGKDYGDDKVVDTDNAVTGGTLSIELNNDEDEIYTYLLGHSKASGSGDQPIIYNSDDEAPKVGVGAVGQSGSKWVAKWYTLVQFSEPNDDNTTKQESVTFNHVTLEGEILIPESGNWKERETFSTLEAAKTWLKSKASM